MLTIMYQSGETRILNPHPLFYSNEKVDTFKKGVSTLEERIKSLIDSFGGNVYRATFFRDGQQVYARINPQFKPEQKVQVKQSAIDKQIKKESCFSWKKESSRFVN